MLGIKIKTVLKSKLNPRCNISREIKKIKSNQSIVRHSVHDTHQGFLLVTDWAHFVVIMSDEVAAFLLFFNAKMKVFIEI